MVALMLCNRDNKQSTLNWKVRSITIVIITLFIYLLTQSTISYFKSFAMIVFIMFHPFGPFSALKKLHNVVIILELDSLACKCFVYFKQFWPVPERTSTPTLIPALVQIKDVIHMKYVSNLLYEFKSKKNCDIRIVNENVAHKINEFMDYIKILVYPDCINQWCYFHREPDMSRNSKLICH